MRESFFFLFFLFLYFSTICVNSISFIHVMFLDFRPYFYCIIIVTNSIIHHDSNSDLFL